MSVDAVGVVEIVPAVITKFAIVPSEVSDEAVTPLASVLPLSVAALAVTVIAADPSKSTPLMARAVCKAVAVAALPVVLPDEPLALPVRFAVIVLAEKLPYPSRATMAEAVLADAAVVAELLTFSAVEIVSSFVSEIAALALMSAFTITPAAMAVALPTLVTSPVRFAFVTTVAALPTLVTPPVRFALVTTVAAKLPVPLPVTPPVKVIV